MPRKAAASESLHTTALAELERSATPTELRVVRSFFSAVKRLYADKRKKFDRVLPFADYLVDRWDKARALGFGKGTNVYDSCLVIGDVKVGKDCWIGPFTILDGSGGLVIGDGCTISAGVHLYTHDNVAKTLDPTKEIERSPVRIGNRVYLGPHVVVARGVTIGDGVVVGAQSFVNRDLPAGAKAAGSPARILDAKHEKPAAAKKPTR